MGNVLLKSAVTVKAPEQSRPPATVGELIQRYLAYARRRYRKKNGTPTGHAENMAQALRAIELTSVEVESAELATRQASDTGDTGGGRWVRVLIDLKPDDFNQWDLRAARDVMVAAKLSIVTINNRVNRIRQVFTTASGWDWCDKGVPMLLKTVEPLEEGRCEAKVLPAKRPVKESVVMRTVERVPELLALAIKTQWHTGMRSGELVQLRLSWITDDAGELDKPIHERRNGLAHGLDPSRMWFYEVPRVEADTPSAIKGHKSDRKKRRIVPLFREARQLLMPAVTRARFQQTFNFVDEAPLFLQENGRPYTVNTYAQFIKRVCKRAQPAIPHWTPHDIRRAFITRMEEKHGRDVARHLAGHTSETTTEGYISRDLLKLFMGLESIEAA